MESWKFYHASSHKLSFASMVFPGIQNAISVFVLKQSGEMDGLTFGICEIVVPKTAAEVQKRADSSVLSSPMNNKIIGKRASISIAYNAVLSRQKAVRQLSPLIDDSTCHNSCNTVNRYLKSAGALSEGSRCSDSKVVKGKKSFLPTLWEVCWRWNEWERKKELISHPWGTTNVNSPKIWTHSFHVRQSYLLKVSSLVKGSHLQRQLE